MVLKPAAVDEPGALGAAPQEVPRGDRERAARGGVEEGLGVAVHGAGGRGTERRLMASTRRRPSRGGCIAWVSLGRSNMTWDMRDAHSLEVMPGLALVMTMTSHD